MRQKIRKYFLSATSPLAYGAHAAWEKENTDRRKLLAEVARIRAMGLWYKEGEGSDE